MTDSNVPSIRFSGFTDPWEQRKLGEIASFAKGNGYSKADIRESGVPLFLYGRMYTQYEAAVESVDTFAMPKQGTLYSTGKELVVPASGESAEDIARASAICKAGIALGGDLNVIYPQELALPLFLAYGLSHGSNQKLLAQRAQGKTVVHIHASDLEGLNVDLPSLAEQQAIGQFFSQLDSLITLHQRKYDKLVVLKKSMLEQMFPQEGESVPRIRFSGFTDPWEQRKLGEYLTLSRIVGHTGVDANKLTVKLWGKGVVAKTDSYGGSRNTQYYVRRAGQFMYGKLDFLHAAFGIVPEELDGYESTLDSPAFDMSGVDGVFLLNSVTQEDFYLGNGLIANGSRKAKRIHEDTFLDMPLAMPSLAEQQAIGRFFSRLDSLITLHQRKLELLQNIKKSLLEQMFV